MSHPPPPGTSGSSSLPPRPPPPAKNSKPAPFTGFAPRAVAAQKPASRGPATGANATFQANAQPYSSNGQASYQAGPQPAYSQPSYYPQQQQQQQQSQYDYAQAPQIRNPFAPPSAADANGTARFAAPAAYDPELEAQIANWQSAYAPRDPSKFSAAPAGPASHLSAAELSAATGGGHDGDSGVASVVTGSDGQRKTVVRRGGGATWTDSSLLEWDPSHFRIFVGNLAGEVTDESLFKAFVKYDSIQKARVVRDKRTTKSKGYGFVSFASGDDYFQAAREMQGKYIGSHPVLIKKSTTDIKAVTPKDKKDKFQKKGGKGGGAGGGGRDRDGASGERSYAGGDVLGANTGAGVKKKEKGEKTRGGLKILG